MPTANATKLTVTAQPKQQEKPTQTLDADKLWGNVLIKVKENNLFALSNALKNVNKVEVANQKLILHTNDLSSHEMIDNQDRINVILRMVNLFDDGITAVEVVYDKDSASTQDIKDNLKEVFKNKIKFKE